MRPVECGDRHRDEALGVALAQCRQFIMRRETMRARAVQAPRVIGGLCPCRARASTGVNRAASKRRSSEMASPTSTAR
jgi:hypothetical protein